MNNLKLLIKFPTRNRPHKFFNVLDAYYGLMMSNNFEFIITCDNDDTSMNNDVIRHRLSTYPNLKVYYGNNKTKIQAVNANLEAAEFDILLLASDDMLPVVRGYDLYIKKVFRDVFNGDTDNVAWFNDGFQGPNLNTLSILGRNFYKRFGYIYHPDYKSLYCDLEFTHVLSATRKFAYFEDAIIKHVQYSIVKEEPDELYKRNDSLQHADLDTFNRRKQLNFPIICSK